MPDRPLSSIQGNILKSFARKHGCYLMLQFRSDIRERRSELAPALSQYVTSAWRQAEITEEWKRGGQSAPVGMFGLSQSGYERLGLQAYAPADVDLGAELFQTSDGGSSVYEGTSEFLEEPYRNGVDAFLLIADDDEQRLSDVVAEAKASLRDLAAVVAEEPCYRKVRDTPNGVHEVEHFGFRDQVSAEPDPESVLSREKPIADGSPAGLGCFCVFMKIEQDVAKFREHVDKLTALYWSMHHAVSAEEVEALAVGRFALTGEPLASPCRGLDEFDFNNDPAGEVCPVHSHVRAMNPRIDEAPPIIRRGMSYGDGENVGLLFVSLQRSLLDFLMLMSRARVLRDPLLSNSATWDPLATAESHCTHGFAAQRWTLHGKEVCYPFADVTRLRGSKFFYVPSMDFIHQLGTIRTGAARKAARVR